MPPLLPVLLASLSALPSRPPLRQGAPDAPAAPGDEEDVHSAFVRFEGLLRSGRLEEARSAVQALLETRPLPEARLSILERAAQASEKAAQEVLAATFLEDALHVARAETLEGAYRRLHPRFVERAFALGWDLKVVEALLESPADGTEDRLSRGGDARARRLAEAYLAADLNGEAVSSFEGLAARASPPDDPAAQALALCGLAEALLAVGRYGEAWLRLEEAGGKGGSSPVARGAVARGRGRVLLRAGLSAPAIGQLLGAETADVEAGEREAAALDASLAAEAAGSLSRRQEALVLSRRALEHASAVGDPRVRDASALAYAAALLGAGALAEAAEVLNALAADARAGKRPAALGASTLLKCDLEAARRSPAAAERLATEAASIYRDGGLPFRQALAVSVAFPLRARTGQRGPAMEFYSGLVANLLHMRLPACPEDFRISLGRRIGEAVPLVPGVFAPPTPAGVASLDFFEPFLSADHLRSFRDGLDLRRWLRPPADRPGLPASSKKSAEDGVARLRGELAAAEAAGPTPGGRAQELRRRVGLAEEELRRIEGRDRSLARFLGQFRRVTFAEADAARRNTLGTRGAYLGYFLGEAVSLLAVVTGDGEERIPLPPRRVIEAAVRPFLARLQGREPWDEAGTAEARSIAALLLGPARARLSEKREIWISPDGILQGLPFELLSLPEEKASSEEPIGLRRSVAYVPSFRFLLPDAAEPPEGLAASTDLLVVAGPGFGPTGGKVAGIEYALGAGSVPGEAAVEGSGDARELALRVARPFCSTEDLPRLEGCLRGNGTIALPRVHARAGDQATEDALWGDRTEYRAVVYTLPWAPGARARWLAGFSCSPDATLGRSAEGFLYPFEVRQALYRAELVLLPTTRVAIEEESPLPLFTRSFLSAGAKRVLYRLFPGADDAAFLGDLSAALSRAPDRPVEALAAARAAARGRSADPRAWAGFVLHGDPR